MVTKILFFSLFFGAISETYSQSMDRAQWDGIYVTECSGMNVTHTRSYVVLESLEVSHEGKDVIAILSVYENGDLLHLTQRWFGKPRDDSVEFSYDKCLPLADGIKCIDDYKNGTPMIKLTLKHDSTGLHQIATLRKYKSCDSTGYGERFRRVRHP